jgi:hypothetical protein
VTTPLPVDPAEAGLPQEPTAPGAQDPAPQQEQPNPTPQPLGKPNATPGAPPEPKPEPAADPQDVTALPDWAQKLIKDARADAGKARTTAKQQAADEARTNVLADISKALGITSDAEPTVESLTEQLNQRQARIDELEAKDTERNYRETVRTAADAAGADVGALLDSNQFLTDVQAELPDEFTDEQLNTAVGKVAGEYAKKPRFAKSAPAARSGGEITGGPPPTTPKRPRSLTEALGRAYGG